MHALQWIKSLLTVDDSILNEQFMLTPDNGDMSQGKGTTASEAGSGSEGAANGGGQPTDQDKGKGEEKDKDKGESKGSGAQHPADSSSTPSDKTNGAAKSSAHQQEPSHGQRQSIKPVSLSDYIENAEKDKASSAAATAPASDVLGQEDAKIDGDVERTRTILKTVFHIPPNADFVLREFTVGTERPWRALAIFIDGMSDKAVINEHILEPLMMISKLLDADPKHRMDDIVKTLILGNQIDRKSKWMEIINGIVTGSTAVFIEGCEEAVIVDTKGWEHRSVGKPTTEQVVRGSHDAFTEMFRANTGLIRARIRSENLITEMVSVGTVAKTDIAVMYISGLTNTKLVEEVKHRLSQIDVDFLADSGVLEQFLEDNPKSMIPQIMSTERPDRATELLIEGHVVILIGQNPYALIVPTVLWTLVHSSEDSYLKAPFGTFVRLIRWIAVVAAILLPSFYVALTNYHSEMLPTDLMLAIAGSREQVPFPVILEVLMMEFALELIREAGIRIPSVIGPTIGMVDTSVNRKCQPLFTYIAHHLTGRDLS